MQKDHMYQLLFQAIQEGSVAAVQKAASSIFGSATAVTDDVFRVLSADIDPGSTDDMLEKGENITYVSGMLLNLFREHNLISSLHDRPHETMLVDWGYFSQHPHITTGIFWQGQFLGTITVLVESADYTRDQAEALQACADALALVMRTNEPGESGKKMLSTERGRFISKLFHGFAKQRDLQAAAEKRFFLPCAPYVMLATEFIPKRNRQEAIAQNPNLLFYQKEGIAYLLAPVQNPELLDWQKQIKDRGYRFGLSYHFSDPILADRMARQAAAVLEYGNRSELEKADWPFPEYALDMMIQETSNVRDFVHPGLLEMEQYDRNNHTEYLNTLWIWLREKMDYSSTAKLLHLHRNSLYYRMERIRYLFSLDLDDMNINVQLYLSLRENKFK